MRVAYFILPTKKAGDGQYIPCIAKEDEKGYYETDWRWGTDLETAEELAKQKNETMGLTEDDVNRIVCSTMKP